MNHSAPILSLFIVVLLSACTKDGFEKDYSVPVNKSITKVSLNEVQTGYMKAGNQFSLNLFDKVFNGNDLVLSPLSLQMALAMSLNGATGETADEIINALGYRAQTENDINEYCKLLMEQLPNVDKSVTLNILNGIVVDDEFTLKKDFTKKLKKNYYAPAESYPFESPETLERINDWAGRNTDWQVYPLLDKLSPNAVAVILDAIYFKAKWGNTIFQYSEPENLDFADENGKLTKREFMCTLVGIPYYSTEEFQLIEIPYENGKFAMYVMLPCVNKSGSCKELIASLTEEALCSAINSLKRTYVYVAFPKYETESNLKLKEQFQKVGIVKAFDKVAADFSKMYENEGKWMNVWIDDVYQKTRFKVNEWGTEAASVTAVEYAGELEDDVDPTGKTSFIADHPFLYFVVEKGTGAILFEGVFAGTNGND